FGVFQEGSFKVTDSDVGVGGAYVHAKDPALSAVKGEQAGGAAAGGGGVGYGAEQLRAEQCVYAGRDGGAGQAGEGGQFGARPGRPRTENLEDFCLRGPSERLL